MLGYSGITLSELSMPSEVFLVPTCHVFLITNMQGSRSSHVVYGTLEQAQRFSERDLCEKAGQGEDPTKPETWTGWAWWEDAGVWNFGSDKKTVAELTVVPKELILLK